MVEAAGFTFGFCEDPWGTRIEVIDDMDHGGAPGLHHVHVFSDVRAVATADLVRRSSSAATSSRSRGLPPLHSILYDNRGDETWLIVNPGSGRSHRHGRHGRRSHRLAHY